MEKLTITTVIHIYQYNELDSADKKLIDAAKSATTRSYSPYSKFAVGAAVRLSNNTVVTGSNQENAAYPSGLCAERITLFYANAQYPDQAVMTLAIAAHTKDGFLDNPIPPCGACRQVMLETEQRYHQQIRILLYGEKGIYLINGINGLLPLSFGASNMNV
ncbi:MAG: cytidine deaminase [Bacteroidaceae bacterium]|nr:cytidine deaminase [Bacteroidaceae bacterium]